MISSRKSKIPENNEVEDHFFFFYVSLRLLSPFFIFFFLYFGKFETVNLDLCTKSKHTSYLQIRLAISMLHHKNFLIYTKKKMWVLYATFGNSIFICIFTLEIYVVVGIKNTYEQKKKSKC